MAQKQDIKTLEDAERVIKGEHAHLYLISFVDAEGRPGSTVIGMAEDAPLYKPYFIFNEVNKDAHMVTILSIVKLTEDTPEIIGVLENTDALRALIGYCDDEDFRDNFKGEKLIDFLSEKYTVLRK